MSKKHDLYKIADAMEAVALFSLALWFEGDQHRCIEASIAGAEALRSFGIDAKPIYVSAVLGGGPLDDASKSFCFGHNSKSMKDWLDKETSGASTDWPIPPLETTGPLDQCSEQTKNFPFHAAIRARHGGGVMLIDLTLGQANNGSAGRIVPAYAFLRGEWPTVTFSNGVWIEYAPPQYPDQLDYELLNMQFKGLAEDLADTTRLALKVGKEQTVEVLQSIGPRIFDMKLRERRS